MRPNAGLTNAVETAVSHLRANGAKYLDRGRAVHGGSRLTSWRESLEECRNLREVQFHLDLFCSEIGCSTLQLELSLAPMADRGLIYGVLPMLPVE